MSIKKHIRFDWAIKRLLRQKANFTVLEGFLSELLFDKIIIREILEGEGNQEVEDDKFNRVDILVKDSKEELILIEVQNESEHEYFHRMNYGQAKLITEHIDMGDSYDKIKKVISINIVYFDLGHGNDYIYIGKTEFTGMHTSEKLELSEKQKQLYPVKEVSDIFTKYYILKVNKFNEVAKNTLDEWIYFLKTSEIKDEFNAQGLKEAKEILRVDNLSPEEKRAYYNYIEGRRIREGEHKSALFDGYWIAKEELESILEQERKEKEKAQKEKEQAQKEKEKVQIESARQMKRFGMPLEDIIKATGLSKHDIENL
ncbi:MAG: Rpn family recombination-promoting nuclease/putative transposase [Bacteroidetes bacterium]|nr:Rpn family recombination-promoting nuclease/putative transposase [Bacteroidota bacterium]